MTELYTGADVSMQRLHTHTDAVTVT